MGVLQHVQHQISSLNDLIKINNDRIAGYEKANESTNEIGLNLLFKEYIDQSKANVSDLKEYIHVLGGDPTDGTSLSGKLNNTWIDVKAAFGSKDRHGILADCERAEDVAKKAYRAALDDKELIWEDQQVVFILKKHLESLIVAHDTIKALRDAEVNA
ncbi:conserved hypothetical protein [Mucilaginibacter lappiensis]|uniref:Uncharacterized protein (TIGR02284 family) n=1 Tax=Mucilaginibacter lappiensis TaxID=354630 RepID=A0ABR6PKC4_9SPHI|nr:PA2169 family four-helix-bundle protein [Mucilaginibacter lappiensis]MBB6109440.1 uncharacterized protein (TIGR02284 family) [Mucilaginibacter lappiensis]SIQ95335.1 conserved hypothetical protein [Mucilaginibacter lappiensis]